MDCPLGFHPIKGDNHELINNFKIMEEALTNDQIRTIPDEDTGVVILNGEAYMNIDGRYVLDSEAQVILQERRVRRETEKLRQMEEALFKKADELKKKKEGVVEVEKVEEVIS